MVFRDQTYSVLIVSASEQLNKVLRKLLPVNTFWPVTVLNSVNAARRMIPERSFDLVIVNAPLPDDYGLQLALDLSESSSGILLLTGSDQYEQVLVQTEERGILTISRPVTERFLYQSLHLLTATCERMDRMMARQVTVEEKIVEIRLINQAKWVLIESRGMTEPEAHKYLEKYAMDRRISKRSAAEEILESQKESR